jgi:hypothetical protein
VTPPGVRGAVFGIGAVRTRRKMTELDPTEEHCAERATLSHAVANAITEAYLRKKAYDDAKVKGDPIVLWAALQAARDSLLKAGDALNRHIEEHGCKS